MPRIPGIDYLKFVSIYMLAYVAAVLSHVPGGYGLLSDCAGLSAEEYHPAGIAALLIFRVIYYWVPMLIAMTWLLGHEFTLRKAWLATLAERICGGRRRHRTQHRRIVRSTRSVVERLRSKWRGIGNGQPVDSAGKIRPRS